jgi:hypothetical protein
MTNLITFISIAIFIFSSCLLHVNFESFRVCDLPHLVSLGNIPLQRLRVFENRVLRRIFGSKMDEATGEWRRLHTEEFNDLYTSPNIIRVIKSRRMRRAGHVARVGEKKGAYRILVGRPEGRRPLGKPRRRGDDNIKMDLENVGCGHGLD